MPEQAQIDFVGTDNILAATLDGLDGAMKAAGQLWGKSLDVVTKAGEKLEQKMGAIDSAVNHATGSWEGFRDTGFLIAEALDKVTSNAAGAGKSINTWLGENLSGVLDLGDALIDRLPAALDAAGSAFGVFGKVARGALSAATGGISFLIENGIELVKWLAEFGDLGEQTMDMVAALGETFLGSASNTEEYGNAFKENIVDTVGQGIKYVADLAVRAGSLVQTVAGNLGLSFEIAWKSAELSALKFWEGTKHFFTVSMPAYLGWLSENWLNVFKDIASFTSAIVSNMWENLKGFFSNTWKWLTGQETDWKWVGLTEGFESTLTELPKIAERHKGDLEKSLEVDLGNLTSKFNDQYTANLKANQDRLAAILGRGDEKAAPEDSPAAPKVKPPNEQRLLANFNKVAGKWAESALESVGSAIGTATGKAQNAASTAVDKVASAIGGDAEKPAGDGNVGGYESGLLSVFQRIQGAAAVTGPEKDQADTAKNTKKTADAADASAGLLKTISDTLKGGLKSVATFG